MRTGKLLLKLASGQLKNIRFRDIQRLLDDFGFELDRIAGSHHIYTHPDVAEIINIQDVKGEAKPYQIRQIIQLIERYGLAEEE